MVRLRKESARIARSNSLRAKHTRKARARKAQSTPEVLPVLGALGNCWCGRPNGHTWPGQEKGEGHPR